MKARRISISRDWFQLILLFCVCLLSIVFLRCAYCLDEVNSLWALRSGIAMGFFSEVFAIYSKWKHKRIVHVLIAIVLLVGFTLISYNYHNGINPLMIIVYTACFVVPVTVVYLISVLPIPHYIKDAAILSLLVFVICAFTCALGNGLQNAISVVIGIALYYHVIREVDNPTSRLVILAVFVLCFAVLICLFGNIDHTLFPMVMYALSLFSAHFIVRCSNSKRYLLLNLGILAFVLFGLSWWLTFPATTALQSLDRDSCEQRQLVKSHHQFDYMMITSTNDTLLPQKNHGKIVAVMFWTSRCGYCHERFKDFSELAAKFEADSSVLFISAFMPSNNDSSCFYAEVQKEQYHFIWAITEKPEIVKEELRFNGVPHLVIIKEDGSVAYNGLYSTTFVYDPARIIKRLRKMRFWSEKI